MKLSDNAAKAISAYVSADTKLDGVKNKMADVLFADGVRAEHLFASNPDTGELFNQVKIAIKLGFPAAIQSLLKKHVKTLSDEDKKLRSDWNKRIGAKMGDIRKALLSREPKPVKETDTETDNKEKTSKEEDIANTIGYLIDKAKSLESTTIKDLNKFIDFLTKAKALIPIGHSYLDSII